MKKILLVLILILTFLFTACSSSEDIKKDSDLKNVEFSNRFKMTADYYYIDDYKFNVLLDTKTNNLYLYRKQRTYRGSMVPVIIPLYDNEKPTIENKEK